MSERKRIKFADLARHWGFSKPYIRKLVTNKDLPVNAEGFPAFTTFAEADTWLTLAGLKPKGPKPSEKNPTEVGEKNARVPNPTTNGNTDKEDGTTVNPPQPGADEGETFELDTDESNDPSGDEARKRAEKELGAFAGKRQLAPRGTLPLINVEEFVRTDKDFDSLMIEQAERVPQIAFGLLTLKQKTGVSTAIANATDVWQQSAKAAASVRERFLDVQERTRALIQIDAVMDIVGTELQALRSFLDKLGDRIGAAANPQDPALATKVINEAIDKVYERMEAVRDAVEKEFSAGEKDSAP